MRVVARTAAHGFLDGKRVGNVLCAKRLVVVCPLPGDPSRLKEEAVNRRKRNASAVENNLETWYFL